MKTLALITATIALIAAATASAQVGGATYNGRHSAGGTFMIKLSSDARRVIAYKIPSVATGECTFVAGGDEGVFQGVEIENGHFSYSLGKAIVLEGDVKGRTATGTFRLQRTAIPGLNEACDSGTVNWSAAAPGADAPDLPTPDPTPTPEPTQPAGGGSGGGGTKNPPARRVTIRTTVSVSRPASTRLSGRLRSSMTACRVRRSVTLRRGTKTIARASSSTSGTFSFKRTSATRGRSLRVVVPSRALPAALCASVTSKTFRG